MGFKKQNRYNRDLHTSLNLLHTSTENDAGIYVVFGTESPKSSPNDKEAQIISDDNNSKISSLSGHSYSSRGSVQDDFRDRVLNRDNNMCWFCKDTKYLEAAHVFEVFNEHDLNEFSREAFFEKYNICTVYETRNGITLCKECHGVFDAALCCVTTSSTGDGAAHIYTLLVADAVIADREFHVKWNALNNCVLAAPNTPLKIADFPTPALFMYRQ